MSSRKPVVQVNFDGFRQSDHQQILALLTDDVVWELPGFKRLVGKAAFDGEIENEAFVGRPHLDVSRLVEEGDTIVALGEGRGMLRAGGEFRFAFSTVFTFADDLIARVESYIVPLTQ